MKTLACRDMTQKSMSFIYVVMVTVEEFLKKKQKQQQNMEHMKSIIGKTSKVNQCLMTNIWRLK